MATLPDQLLKELADKLAVIESSDAAAAGPVDNVDRLFEFAFQ